MLDWLIPVLVVAAIVVLIGLYIWITHTKLMSLSTSAQYSWGQVRQQFAMRGESLVALVELVEQTTEGDGSSCADLVRSSQKLNGSQTAHDASMAESEVQQALKKVFGLVESYPKLGTSQRLLELQAQVVAAQDKILQARRTYNGDVRRINTKIRSFPTNIIARSAHVEAYELFEDESSARIVQPPRVEF